MAAPLENKKIPFQAILEDLGSGNDQKISKSIAKLRNKGNAMTAKAVIDLLSEGQSAAIEAEIFSYLNDLKNESALEPLIEAIEEEKNRKYKSALIAVFWQSSLDGSDYLGFFVNQAIYNATYIETLEVLTVIENLKGPFSEEELIDAISLLNEHVEEEEEERKRSLMINLLEVLNQI